MKNKTIQTYDLMNINQLVTEQRLLDEGFKFTGKFISRDYLSFKNIGEEWVSEVLGMPTYVKPDRIECENRIVIGKNGQAYGSLIQWEKPLTVKNLIREKELELESLGYVATDMVFSYRRAMKEKSNIYLTGFDGCRVYYNDTHTWYKVISKDGISMLTISLLECVYKDNHVAWNKTKPKKNPKRDQAIKELLANGYHATNRVLDYNLVVNSRSKWYDEPRKDPSGDWAFIADGARVYEEEVTSNMVCIGCDNRIYYVVFDWTREEPINE